MRARFALTVCACTLLAACNLHPIQGLDEAIEAVRIERVAGGGSNKVDILFVIDDSRSMAQEQAFLTGNFQDFLQGIVDANADFHIAVITTDARDPNDAGAFRSGPGPSEAADDFCVGPPPSLEDCNVGDSVLRFDDYVGDDGLLDITGLARDFECVATVGNCGHFIEAGLDTLKRSLSPDRAQTSDFIRDDASLAVIIVSDEDDCSVGEGRALQSDRDCFITQRDQLEEVEAYRDFLVDEVKNGDGSAVLVAGIIAPTPPNYTWQPGVFSCTAPGVTGAAGQRYQEFIRLFGARGVQANICAGDFAPVLRQISSTIGRNIDVNCLTENIPTCDPEADDCLGDATCEPVFRTEEVPETGVAEKHVCSDFELSIEVRNPGEEEFTVWEGVGPAGDTPPDFVTPDSAQYEVVYYADSTGSCPNTGVGFRFLQRPANTAEIRALYPVSFDDD